MGAVVELEGWNGQVWVPDQVVQIIDIELEVVGLLRYLVVGRRVFVLLGYPVDLLVRHGQTE